MGHLWGSLPRYLGMCGILSAYNRLGIVFGDRGMRSGSDSDYRNRPPSADPSRHSGVSSAAREERITPSDVDPEARDELASRSVLGGHVGPSPAPNVLLGHVYAR